MLFVTNLKSDQRLAAGWTALLTKISEALQQAGASGPQHDAVYANAIKAANNFLADNNYNTTAVAVLALLKSPFYEEQQKASEPNAASDKFVQDLLTQPTLFKEWNAALASAAGSGADLSSLNAFLTDHGYACTYVQINASWVKMRHHQLTYWSGTYNTSMTKIVNGKPVPPVTGPTLVIYGSKAVSLVDAERPQPVSDSNMVYDNSVLSWDEGVLGGYGGKLAFSEITQPSKQDPYKGPIFTGTLTKKDGSFDPFGSGGDGETYHVAGQLSPKPNNAGNIPADVHPSEMETIIKWVNYCLIGFMIVKWIASMGKKFTNTKDFNEASDGAVESQLDSEVSESQSLAGEVEADTSSPFSDLDFASSNVLADLEEQLEAQQAAGEAEAAAETQADITDAEADETAYDGAADEGADVSGDGWASELEGIAGDLI